MIIYFYQIVLQGFWLLVTVCWPLASGLRVGQKQDASSKGPESDIGNPVFGIKFKLRAKKILLFELSYAVC